MTTLPRQGRTLILASLLAAVGLLGCSDGSSNAVLGGTDIQVDDSGGADFASLRAAVDAAPPGAVIRVADGTYDGQVVVARSVRIVGAGPGTVIRTTGTPQAFSDDSGVDDGIGTLEIRNTSGVTLENVTIVAPQDGVVVRDSRDVSLINVTITGSGDDGVDVRSSSNVSVSGTFEGNGDHGVIVREGSSDVVVRGSRISGNVENGVRVRDSARADVDGNTITTNGDDGVLVRDSTGSRVGDNEITDNGGYGIRLRSSADTVVENNQVTGNVEGDVRND